MLNINLLKGLWSAWSALESTDLRTVSVENMPEHLWTDKRVRPPAAALQLHQQNPRSPRLEPTVPTNGSNGNGTYGSNERLQPPLSSHLSPSSSLPLSSSVVTARGSSTGPDDDRTAVAAARLGRHDHDQAIAAGVGIRTTHGHLEKCIANRHTEQLTNYVQTHPELDVDAIVAHFTTTTTERPPIPEYKPEDIPDVLPLGDSAARAAALRGRPHAPATDDSDLTDEANEGDQ